MLFLSLGLLYVFSIQPTADLLLHSLEDIPPLRDPAIHKTKADIIVVLGGGVYTDLTEYSLYRGIAPSYSSMFRTRYAAYLYHKTHLPILCSGGAGPIGKPEAQAMRTFLLELQVPPDKILTEARSQNTWENALYSSRLLKTLKMDTIILVTNSYHCRRAKFCFEKFGLNVIPAPTGQQLRTSWKLFPLAYIPQAKALAVSSKALEEWGSRLYYHLKYGGYVEAQEPHNP